MTSYERLGPHNDRVSAARDLHQAKGRWLQRRYIFEGPTLLQEARASGVSIEELFVSESVMMHNADVAGLAQGGVATAVVDDRTMRKLSDLETPTGLVAIARIQAATVAGLFGRPGTVLVLADINDPGNAGTLLRSAEAFGATGVLFGSLAVDPYHPKVVRAAMGSLFRLPVAVGEPVELRAAADAAKARVIGLSASGASLGSTPWPEAAALVVGHERRGLSQWEEVCDALAAIPMTGITDSLNAAVAGSIALYEAARRT